VRILHQYLALVVAADASIGGSVVIHSRVSSNCRLYGISGTPKQDIIKVQRSRIHGLIYVAHIIK
jgi:hypothetical protein